MSMRLYESNDLQNIANAIRNKNGSSDKYKVSEMANAIDNMQVITSSEGINKLSYNASKNPVIRANYKGNVEQEGTPTPDNPQEVKTLKGWNLFDEKNFNWSTTGDIKYESIYVGKGTYLVSSTDMPDGQNKTCNFFAMPNRVTTGASSAAYGVSKTISRQLTTSDGYITIVTRTTTSENKINPKDYHFQIVEGTQEKPYLPYNSIGVKRIGKSLYNLEDIVTITSGSEKWKSYGLNNFNWKQGQEYYFKLFATKQSNETAQITNYGYAIIYNTMAKITFNGTIPYIRIGANTLNSTINDEEIKLMVSTTPIDDYQPYQERIDYIDLQDNEVLDTDEVKIENGRVKLVKKWGKVVLDGSESYGVEQSGVFYRFNIVINDMYNYNGRGTYAISNHFHSQTDNDYGAIITYQNRIMLYPNNTSITTSDKFKTWLSQNKPIVYYQLAEPQEIELPNADIQTIDGLNNVEIMATMEPTYMKEEYIK